MEAKEEPQENATQEGGIGSSKKQLNKEESNANTKKGSKKTPQKNKTEVKRKEHKDTKFGINNQIIKHQSVFKKGKVFATRKLVQKIKAPKKKANENVETKTQRFESVLNAIKQMSARRLAALALANYKSPKNALANVESTPEQLAVGYFANLDFVQKALESIYQTMNLDGCTTFWKKQIRKLFMKKDEVKKSGDTKKKSKNSKTKGEVGTKKEQNKSETNDQESSDGDTVSDEGSDHSDGEHDELNEDCDELEKSTQSTKAKKPALGKIKAESPKPAKDKKTKKQAESTVDDFFITAEGTSYLSTAVVKEEPKDKKGTGEAHAKPQQAKWNKSFEKAPHQTNHAGARHEPRQPFKRPFEEVTEPKKEIDPNLHPSWLAKQKQKPIIAGFQGKKITFD